MFKINVPFPNREELNTIVQSTILKQPVELHKLLNSSQILELRLILEKVVVVEPIRDYAIRLVLSTHPGTDFASEDVRRFIHWGASPRAAQSLVKAARVRALSEGRAHVAFEDIRYFANEVLQHRVLLNYDGQAENIRVSDLIEQICLELPEKE